MPIATESRIAEKIQEILDEQRLETDELFGISQLIRKYRTKKWTLPHSLHLNVWNAKGELLHLRALVWKTEEWRNDRRDCIDNHRRIYASTQRTERGFRVPRMVRSGDAPLVWDLTEFVDARNLPWSYEGPRRLQEHIRRVDAFFRVSDDMASIRLRSVKPRDWDKFAGDLYKWSSWADRAGIMSTDAANDIQHITEEFELDLPRTKLALTHGDFNPSNVMFSTRGKPWLIDFDHLRLSVPADNLARLLTVSWVEAGWRERVFAKALKRFETEQDRRGFVVAAAWHTMNGWRRDFDEYPPIRRIHSLDQLNALMPGTKFRINQQRHLLERVVDEFLS